MLVAACVRMALNQ